MKKLLVAAIGAVAAYGASAGSISEQRFENVQGELPRSMTISDLNTLAEAQTQAGFWSGDEITNKYTAVTASGFPQGKPLGTPTKALKVETKFGNPLSLNAIDGGTATNIPASGIYFDSLVKFTVCDGDGMPELNYDNAKIVMWLQENEELHTTNIMVRAGYINSDYTCTTNDYVCYTFTGDIEQYHRVTIKTWASIFEGRDVPGFAIFLDNDKVNIANGKSMADGVVSSLTEAAGHLGASSVFPSLVQGNATGASEISTVAFDGTGYITDLVFTDEAPFDAAEDWVDDRATVNGTGYKTLEAAVAAVNEISSGDVTFALAKDMTHSGTLAFSSGADVVIFDFHGFTLTQSGDDAVISIASGSVMLTNSTEAVGGIVCANYENTAVELGENGENLFIGGGCFKGKVVSESLEDSAVKISAGSFSQNNIPALWLADGKVANYNSSTGLYDIEDYVAPTYTVTFDSNGGSTVASAQVTEGDTVDEPTAPTKTGFVFDGWYLSENRYNFSTAVTGNITLLAHWRAPTWADYLGAAVDGAYEIDNLTELKAFQANVATNETSGNKSILTTTNLTFKLTADIELDAAWPGIGVQNGKDIYSTETFNGAAFCGTFDGQNHTISGFQMVGVAGNPANNGEGLDYCGFFNSTYGATIQNLKIQYAGSLFAADTTASTKESGATFVGVAKNSTLRNLTTVAGTVSCSKGFGGIVGYLMGGSTVDSCTNNVNMTSLANNKCGGIAMITQNGSATAIISDCQNNGTQTTGSANSEYGAIVGYVGQNTTIADCETTVGRFLKHQGSTVTLQGVNKGDARVLAYDGIATPGLNFATVDGNVATFVADNALALNGSYTVMGSGATATFAFAEAGTIAFDTNLTQNVTFNITAPGLTLTDSTSGTVTTYTATSSSSWPQPSEDTPAAVDTALAADGFSTGTGVVTSKAEYSALIDYVTAKTSATSPEGLTDAQKANAVLCYALDAESIPTTEITKEDITIDALATGANGAVDLTVAIDGVEVGSSVPAATLAKIVTAKGGTALNAMSTENVTVNGHVVQTGRVKITVTPNDDSPTSFFTTVIINK